MHSARRVGCFPRSRRFPPRNFKAIAPPETFAGFDTIREETFWGIGANLEVPLRDNMALGVGIEYNRNEANLDRDDYDNFKVVIGPQGRF